MDNWRSILLAVLHRLPDGVLEGMFVFQLRHCDQLKTELAHYDRADADDPIRTYADMFNMVLRTLKPKSEEKFRSVEKNKVNGTGGGLNAAPVQHDKRQG